MPHRVQRARMRLVRRHQEKPGWDMGSAITQTRRVIAPLLYRRAGRPTIWSVGMVKDENDIIAYTVKHLLEEGVDRVLIADNGSSDGTLETIRELAEEHPVEVVRDSLVAKYQAEKITRLSRLALRSGADWVIPFDADEWWFVPGSTVREALTVTNSDVLYADVFDHVPTTSDPPAEEVPNPYERLRNRVAQPNSLRKVAFRAHPLARVAQGNHDVTRPGRRTVGPIEVRHFSVRSVTQLKRKIAVNQAAYSDPLLTTGGLRIGVQYRQWSAEDWNRWLTGRELVEDPVITRPQSTEASG